ncbi:MAG TPA: elongation factor P [Symbiobacteriaceae bacterium]
MISMSEVRKGTTVEINGDIYQVIDFLHVKPGKGAAFVRAKVKNVRTGSVTETTYNPSEKFPKAQIERREFQYLYGGQGTWTFMNNETYEQLELSETQIGDAKNYLLENMMVNIAEWKGNIIGVDLPNTVELKVVDTEPGFKGDTATGATKAAKLETGYSVNVPLFINVGDVLKVDTRSGDYLGRA